MTKASKDKKYDSKKPTVSNLDRRHSSDSFVLLVGDSILDNRAHATLSTGTLLGDNYIDNSVEETMTADFEEQIRTVPELWLAGAALPLSARCGPRGVARAESRDQSVRHALAFSFPRKACALSLLL